MKRGQLMIKGREVTWIWIYRRNEAALDINIIRIKFKFNHCTNSGDGFFSVGPFAALLLFISNYTLITSYRSDSILQNVF